ncbi:MAG: serine dehydratase subunit alpha family protein [Bacteroidales bacterium]|nr:serine dehydratase subunit alpha family protein [Bacteroidales bacterium]
MHEFIELIKKEVKPALGCTEPIAVALAVAKACEVLGVSGNTGAELEVKVSGNILKNGMGVGIPGTGMVGLYIASALALFCGKSAYGLEVLKDLTPGDVDAAKKFVDDKRVCISLAETDKKLYVEAICSCGGHTSRVIIADNHDSIVYVEKDGAVVCDLRMAEDAPDRAAGGQKTTLDYKLTVDKIYDFACNTPLEDIEFILEGAEMNMALAREGLKLEYGLRVGRTILDHKHSEVFGSGLMNTCMALTAAASDARMAGCTLPAMSNSGSGNQGITVSMPVVAAAQELCADREQLARALVLSNLIAIHIKGYLGKLSALCGCVIASTGSSCGIVMLKGGTLEQIKYAIKNMVGNITGMVCDGAKVGCALKVASGVSSSVQSAILALENICISSHDGIIDEDVEKTIQNLATIGSKGMQSTDNMILDIMVCK